MLPSRIMHELIILRLTIRGREDDDAVLCTDNKTYNIRAVVVSNSFYVLTPPSPEELGDAVIRGSVKQILELSPSIAKLHRLKGLLRSCEYDGDEDKVLKVYVSAIIDSKISSGIHPMPCRRYQE